MRRHYANYYIKNNDFHRIGGPALDCANGTKKWFINGDYHRLDGPAIIWDNGEEVYYVDDVKYSKEYYPEAVEEYLTQQYLKDNNLEIIQ